MKRIVRKTLKWTLIALGVLAVLFLLQISALAYPQPLFEHKVQHGSIVFYSDSPVDAELEAAMLEVQLRLAGNELYDHTVTQHVFVCQNQSTYDLFRRLALIPGFVPGFNLSVFDNSFVSVPRLTQRRHTNPGVVHSTLTGNISEGIAHEVMHDFMVARSGFLASRSLPRWKTEGYAEYAANIALIRADTTTSLSRRISTMQSVVKDPSAHEYYRWALTVEYLCESEAMSYDELMAADVTLDDAYRRMMLWYGQSAASPI